MKNGLYESGDLSPEDEKLVLSYADSKGNTQGLLWLTGEVEDKILVPLRTQTKADAMEAAKPVAEQFIKASPEAQALVLKTLGMAAVTEAAMKAKVK